MSYRPRLTLQKQSQMSEFVKVKSRKKVNGIQCPEVSNESNLALMKASLEKKKHTIKSSTLYENISQTLQPHKISKIRCVALGSPSQEEPALYQLALLLLIVEENSIKSQNVSVYDPVFTQLDIDFFKSLNFEVSEDYLPKDDEATLFFLPHAPLNLTNSVILSQNPKLLLSNNIQTHTERLTKLELFEKYPIMSKLVNLLQPQGDKTDGFEAVVKKKSRKSQRNKFVEPTIDYSKIDSYFENIEIISFKDFEEGEWLNSFTDLAFHRIS